MTTLYRVLALVFVAVWLLWLVRTWRTFRADDDDDEEQEAARRRRALGYATLLDQFRALHRHARKRG